MTVTSAERHQWLETAQNELRALFADKGYTLPADVRVSIGFPKGRHGRKTIGQCFSRKVSADQIPETFISPVLSDSLEILGVMIHENCHAIVGTECGHKGAFRTAALAMGLTGKMTATTNGPELVERLNAIIAKIGAYPAGALVLGEAIKKQSTRMLKAICPCCAYTVRLSRQWAEQGLPFCPNDETQFECGDL